MIFYVGYDLFACEAQYHPSCWKKCTSDSKCSLSSDEQKKLVPQPMEAHKEARGQICYIIDRKLINNNRIVKLTDLVQNIDILQSTCHPNPNHIYRGENLKLNLEKTQNHYLLLGYPKHGHSNQY